MPTYGVHITNGFNPRTPCGVRPVFIFAQFRIPCFHPRTPCGVRRITRRDSGINQQFQSTHSLRSATQIKPNRKKTEYVSIHALLAECDPRRLIPTGADAKFQSTHSLRSATNYADYNWTYDAVSIHALLAECDREMTIDEYRRNVSIHALLAECDRCRATKGREVFVSIHALLAECDSG